ncbi:hypothetical protein NP233_g7556 [Leucocoprinus birnbaumii]|uniref:Uncharacterized protein n=1 Tax=Leucocoprinus birnbaumii TaxID=56174 RepID=A0AAD5YSN5_9AGAR|nr:hypothetical protein NP233_g7556 [Leucocoprinus birnbaumii]
MPPTDLPGITQTYPSLRTVSVPSSMLRYATAKPIPLGRSQGRQKSDQWVSNVLHFFHETDPSNALHSTPTRGLLFLWRLDHHECVTGSSNAPISAGFSTVSLDEVPWTRTKQREQYTDACD